MKLSGQQYQFNQLKNEIHMALARNTFPITIFNTVNHIVRVINAIRDTRGLNWAQTVMDNGQPVFTPIEQQRYTELLQPYIPSILGFFNEEPISHKLQKGGLLPTIGMPTSVLPATIAGTNVGRSALDEEQVPIENAEFSKMSKLQDSFKNNVSEKMGGIDLSSLTPDVLFDKVMSTFQGINRSMNETMDAVHFEKEVDEKPDIPLGQTGIMIPPRFIIFLIYYLLDITRVAVSVHGNETGRKLLSIVVAVLDVVRGDWKKAILTFIGYYGSSPLLIGQALKTYLTVIQMLSPTIQIKLPYFMYDSAKSMVFGILLSIIQIGAPKPVRDQLEKMLSTLSDVQKDIDAKLNALNPPLSSRPDYFKVNFSNLNDLQAILDDPVYICSKEHRDAVENLLANSKEAAPIIQFILSLMRYPHTRGMTQYLCDSKAKKSYVDLLVEEGIERTEDAVQEEEVKPVTKGGTRSKRLLRMKVMGSK
jgi:hypothetical protein